MIVHVNRFVFAMAGASGGFAVSRLIDWSVQTGYPELFVIFIFIILGSSMGYLLGGIFGREFVLALRRTEERLQDISSADLMLGIAGLVLGLVLAWFASQPLRFVEPSWLAVLATVLLFVLAGYSGMRIALVKRADFIGAMPKLSQSATGSEPFGIKVLDTSAVIDGRFAELKELGLLEGELRVPRFVLGELHTLSDSADDTRRARGRRGLDLLARLGSEDSAHAEVFEADYPDVPDVDNKLLRLAAETGAAMITVDHNLTNVARVRGIEVVNLNEIAGALRPTYLPGERLRLRLVKQGKEAAQGVGYLEDGTMVVVAEGSECVGHEVDAEGTSVLQTSAGRMIFSRLLAVAEGDPRE